LVEENNYMTIVESKNKSRRLKAFGEELAAAWRQMPDKGLFLILLAAWAALFHFLGISSLGYYKTASVFVWLKAVLTTSVDDEHGQLVPFVVLGLFWWKRKELLVLDKKIWWPALGLVVLGLLLHLGGYIIQQERVSVVGFFVGLYGLTGLIWGRQWLRASFFPFFLFGFCVPLAAVADAATTPLRLLATKLTVGVAQLLGVDVIRAGSQIFDASHTYNFDVAPACSGIRSLVTLVAGTTIFGFVEFRSTWRRLVMIAAAFPLAVAGNVARLTCVILTAEVFGQDAAAWLEQKLGVVTYLVAIVCVIFLSRCLREPKSEPVMAAEGKTI
jgi:exosortase